MRALALSVRHFSVAARPFWARLTGVVFYTRVRARRMRVSSLVLVTAVLALGVLAAAIFLAPQQAEAGPANTVNFQARLETAAGAIAADGNYNVRFKLYDASSGGTLLWTESYLVSSSQGIRTVNGYLTSNLGSLTAFPGSINWGQQIYLTMEVGGTGSSPTWDGEMSPRLPLTSVPSAFALNSYNSALGYTGSLTVAQPTGGSQTFTVPDQGAAGSYTLLTTAAANSNFIQNQNASAQATSNFWISGTGKAATSLQAPLIDTPAAGTLGIGTSTATAITIGKAGVTTTVAGPLTSTGLVTANGGLTVATGSTFTNASSTVFTAIPLSLGSSAAIGTNTATVDVASNFNITATSAGLTFTLPTPTASTTGGRLVYVSNVGATNSFTMYGAIMAPGTTQSFIYNGSTWTTNGSGPSGNYIQNTTTAQAGANFNIGANGVIGGTLNVTNTTTLGAATIAGVTSINTTGTATTTIGNSTAATAVNILGGTTGKINLTGSIAATGILNANTTGTAATTIGNGTAATAVTLLGGSTGGVNINNGTAATLTNIGTSTGTNAINLGTNTTAAATIIQGSTNAGTTLSLRAGATTLAVTNANVAVTGLLTVSSDATFSGDLTIAAGGALTIGGSTTYGTIPISNHVGGGAIGTAAATVDISSAFIVTQTTAGQTLSIPNPTITTGNRIIYITSASGNVNFTIGGIVMTAGQTAAFIWNPNTSVWTLTMTSGIGTNTIGTFDTFTAAANGATISGSVLYLQSASASVPGMVNLGVQSFAGAKTFNGALTAGAGLTVTGALGVSTTSNLSGVVTLGALGTADSSNILCRNTTNQIATCNLSIGTAFIQNGNSFGATAVLGTNDNNSLQFETNGTARLTLDTSGNATLTGNLTVQGAGTNTFTGSVTTPALVSTAALAVTAAVGSNITIGSTTTTGTITIGGTAQTGVLNLGTGTGAQSVNLGTGGTGAKTVTLGSTAGSSSTTIQSGATGSVTINGGSLATTTNIGTSTGTNAINLGTNTTAAATIIQGSTNAGTTLSLRAGATTLAVTNANVAVTGLLTVSSDATFSGDLTIAAGGALTIGGSNIYGTIAIANHTVNGPIGTAAATVDISSAFIVTQTTAGRTLSVPNPTVTTGNRIIYITSASGNVNFTIGGIVMTAGQTATFIWNPNALVWTVTMTSGIGTNTIGTFDTFTNDPDGATISGSVLYLQSASSSAPGLVNTGTQSFTGAKTFTTNVLTAGAGLTVTGATGVTGVTSINTSGANGTTIGNASSATGIGGALTVTGLTTANGGLTVAGTTGITGTTTINTTGTLSTTIGNGTAATAVTLLGGSTGGVNINNGTAATLTNIGTSTSTNSVNIGTNTTAAATIIQGSSNAGTTVKLQGGATILNITNASAAITGALTVSTTSNLTGIVTLGTLGAANNLAYLCRNSSNQIASCNTTGTGAAFVQGGNTFGATAVLGTNDSNDLQIETNSTTRVTINATTGNATFTGNLTVQGAGTNTFTGSVTTPAIVSSAALAVTAAVGSNITIGSTTTTGTITIGGTAQTGVLNFGTGTGVQSINLGTGGTGAKTVTVGSTASSSTTTINSGATGFVNINSGSTATLTNIGTSTSTNAINIGTSTSAAATIIQGSTNAGTTLSLRAGATALNVTNANVAITGVLTVSSDATFSGDLTIAAGGALTIGGSTTYGTIAIANHGGNGAIGTAAATVDISSAFIVTQNTPNRVLTIPSPTVTTGNRIIYITSVSGNVNFTIGGIVMTAGQTATFIWNPNTLVWTVTMTTGVGTNTIGTFDTFTNDPDGATISGSVLYLQSASASAPGLVNTGTQSFTGAKTFTTNVLTAGAGLNVTGTLAVTGAATVSTTLGVTTSVTTPALISTGALALTAAVGSNITIGSTTTTGSISIGGTAQTGVLNFGAGTGVQSVNVGTGGTGAKTVTVGSTASTSTTTIQGGSGGVKIGTLSTAGVVLTSATGLLSSSATLGIANGGTGSATQNFVDLTTVQASIGGAKTFTSLLTASAGLNVTGTLAVTGAATVSTTLGVTGVTTLSGGLTVNSTTNTGATITSAANVPTTDQLAITNTGSTGVATAGVNGLSIAYKGGATASIESSAARIDLTVGSGASSIWNGYRLVGSTAGAGVTENGLKFDNITGGAGTENAINIGTGWDYLINAANFDVLQSGAVTALSFTGSGAGLTSLNGSNITSGIVGIGFGGTGSATQNFVDLTTVQASIGGAKTFTSLLSTSAGASIQGNTTIATTAGNTLSIGNATGNLTVTGSSASTFNLNGVVVDATEFNLLNGKNAPLVDTNDAVATAITGTGALNAGTITSGFGVINNADTITGTTLNGTTGVNTGAGAGTNRIDASGNLVNIGTYSGSGNITTTGGVLSIQGSGNNYLAGNLGIGVASPQTKLDVAGALSMRYNNVRTYNNVYSSYTAASSQTGTLEIILPNSWNSSMLRFQITGYNYSSTAAWQAIVSGYSYTTTPAWINTSAEIRGGAAPFTSIRLAYDTVAGKTVLLLGTTSTVWNYPQFTIDQVMAGFSNQDAWGSGYSHAFLSSEANISTINSPTTQSVAYTGTTFLQGGNSFGATAVLGTNDAQSLTLRTGGTTRLTIDTSGNSTFTGSITSVGVNSGSGLIQGTGGLTVTGAVNVNTTGAGTTNLGTSATANAVNIGSATTTLTVNSTGFDVSSGGAVTATSTIQGPQLIATVATGTAPLIVASTTVVTNLNADLLDGQDGTYYSNIAARLGYTPSRSATSTNSVYSLDSRSTNYNPQDRDAGLYVDFKANTTDSLADGGSFHGVLTFRPYGAASDMSGGLPMQIANTANANLYIRSATSATAWGGWSKLWDDYNDGSGSGLDADLLDGQSSAAFATAASLSGYVQLQGATPGAAQTGNINVSGTIIAGTIQGGQLVSTVATGTAPLTVSSTTKVTNLNVDSLDGYDSSAFTLHIATADNITTRLDSGFYETSTATIAEGYPQDSNGWYHLLSTTHSNGANYYAMQFAGSFYNSNALYYRATNGVGTAAWSQVWHAGNDGAGSGLDADLLDGLSSAAFAPASGSGSYILNGTSVQAGANFNIGSNGVIGGTLSVTGSSTLAALTTSGELDATGGTGTGYSTAPIEIRTTSTPRIAFHWPGVVASQLGMDSAGIIRTFDNPGTGYERFAANSYNIQGTTVIDSSRNIVNAGTGSFSGNITTTAGTISITSVQNTTGIFGAASLIIDNASGSTSNYFKFNVAGSNKGTLRADSFGSLSLNSTSGGLSLNDFSGTLVSVGSTGNHNNLEVWGAITQKVSGTNTLIGTTNINMTGGAATNIGALTVTNNTSTDTLTVASGITVNGTAGRSLSCGGIGSKGIKSVTFVYGVMTAGVCTTSNLTDLAEQYASSQHLVPGEIVAPTSDPDYRNVERSSSHNQDNIIGVVSTAPADVLGQDLIPDGYPIALAGRIPTKVNLEGGVIHKGDKITSSSVPGVGMKANGPGMVVGVAFEDYDGTGSDSLIEVFVQAGYYEPPQGDTLQANNIVANTIQASNEISTVDLNVSGKATIQTLEVLGNASFGGDLRVTGTANVANIIVGKHILSQSTAPLIVIGSAAGQDGLVNIDGTDVAGTLNITVKAHQHNGQTEVLNAGTLADVTFLKPYEYTPRIVISPTNDASVGVPVYLVKTNEGYKLMIKQAATDGAQYQFDYIVIGSNGQTASSGP